MQKKVLVIQYFINILEYGSLNLWLNKNILANHHPIISNIKKQKFSEKSTNPFKVLYYSRTIFLEKKLLQKHEKALGVHYFS